MTDWNPAQYLKFADERTRPARDLLTQVPLTAPGVVHDLGCGPGNSTALLVERFPAADITGIDNSPAMLRQARQACGGARFELGDLSTWMPPSDSELLFSNATFQWVPDHLAVLERLTRALPAGGVLAIQMPDNLVEPSHRLMEDVGRSGPWAGTLAAAAAARDPLPPAQIYYERLKPMFSRLDIWHTIYNHPLEGVRGIIDWLQSTGLRPYLNPLSESERQAYLTQYEKRLAAAYPALADGTVLLRFPRLFLVGVR
jgi:trans-aconitate 2-methyltransferase